MGEVHRAHDTRRDREVALKLLPESMSADEEFRDRFRREAAITAKLRDPHVIPIHDFGEINGRLFLDMRLVDGADLATVLAREEALPTERAVTIIEQIAAALDAAHADGLIHRDIKPSNVLLASGRAEFCYLVDFGIARAASASTRSRLTATGATIGTLDYMAPERFLAGPIDHRVDVYSLACLLYECLTGQAPFPGDELAVLLNAHLNLPPPRPSQQVAGLPAGLDGVVVKGMAKSLDERYASAGELAAAARAVLTPRPAPADAQQPVTMSTQRPAPVSAEPSTPITAQPSTPDVVKPPPIPVATSPEEPPVPSRDAVQTVVRNAAEPTYIPQPSPPTPTSTHRRNRSSVLIVAVLAVAAVVAGALFFTRHTNNPRAIANTVTATILVGLAPEGVVLSPDGRRIYVTNSHSNSVSVIDTDSKTLTATIPVGQKPRSVAFTPDGRRIYVTNNDSNSVSVIDTASNTVTTTIPVGADPSDVAVTPDGRRAYVTNSHSNSVSVIDTANNTVTVTIPAFQTPAGVGVSPDGRRVYVSNYFDSNRSDPTNSVSVIDTASNTVAGTIPVGFGPENLAFAPDGRHAYVANSNSNSVSVIDTASNTVTATVPVGRTPVSVVISPDGQRAYVTNYDSKSVLVIDTATNTVTATIPVSQNPTRVTLSPDGRHAYVTNTGGPGTPSNTVSVIDTGFG
jgi:serine/threonine-protein kinase